MNKFKRYSPYVLFGLYIVINLALCVEILTSEVPEWWLVMVLLTSIWGTQMYLTIAFVVITLISWLVAKKKVLVKYLVIGVLPFCISTPYYLHLESRLAEKELVINPEELFEIEDELKDSTNSELDSIATDSLD